MKEQFYDDMLNIKTTKEQKGFHESYHYHRYEPTPYKALEKLFNEYKLNEDDRIVDFGCGKGRLNFYINYLFDATTIGVEMDQAFLEEAIKNRENYLQKHNKGKGRIHFYQCLAQDYKINSKDNKFYFFNPFSVQIFINVINSILLSMEENKREIDIILYYGSEDYIYYLENSTMFKLIEEVILPGFTEQKDRERILIYRLC